ncbi:MAG: TlpA disulfide reductase family protein [Myxococcota bacterium]
MLFRTAMIALLAAGCATADQVQSLEEKIDELEIKVAKLEERSAAAPAAAAGPSADEEAAAQKMYEEVASLVQAGKMSEAKAQITDMEKKYSNTRIWRRARKMAQELEVIGKKAPDALAVEKWFNNQANINFASSEPTLIVFWEQWCPHCKREVPKLQETYSKYNPQGLQMVGLTKVTRSSTDDSVAEFIQEKSVSYPIAKESGDMSAHFNVSGIPAAAVVKDGEIIWRGHPARLTDEMIQGWL